VSSQSGEPRWLELTAVEEIHRRLLAAHGGAWGVRDAESLEAALAHPLNLFSYGSESDLVRLAAGYAASISRRHPFVDGNKRTAFMAAYVFLRQNGWRIEAEEAEVVHVVRALAAGELDEAGFATWLRQVVVAV
jgi:death-on-curing protein